MGATSTSTEPATGAGEPLTLAGATEHLARRALRPGPVGTVGLEYEAHLVDLAQPEGRVGWARIHATLSSLPPLTGGSRVSVEPGGQVELSTPPSTLDGAIGGLRSDLGTLREALASVGLGLAGLGADPARPVRRVHPGPRYAAMEEHFCALGYGGPGRAMMCSTAALQVNLEAGPEDGWATRVALAHRLGPVLAAASACAPLLAGRPTGWRSARQGIWASLEPARCRPLVGGSAPLDPAGAWARYALDAPVMLVRHGGGPGCEAVARKVPLRAWVAGEARLGGRAPTALDLDYHLTTLFPPVRPRGWLELRFLDAVPDRWWPALVTVAAVLMDDPRAAQAAWAATEALDGRWGRAARLGLDDPALRRAALYCLEAAAAAAPGPLRAEVEAYALMVAAGRTPGDVVGERATRHGPIAALEEECHAR